MNKKQDLVEIKKNQVGHGLLIEHDGYISLSDKRNKVLKESFESEEWYVPCPFVLHAVFQKADKKNANGRVYPRHVLEKCLNEYQERIRERRALGECFRPSAMVMTEDGMKPLSSIKEGDNIYTLSIDTHEISIQKVERKIEKDFDGELIHLYSNGIDTMVTPNHKFYLIDKNGNDRIVKAIDIFDHQKDYNSCIIPNMSQNKFDLELNFEIQIKDIKCEKVPYKGTVMCLEVENHIFYVSENEKGFWTHNCNHPESSTLDLSRISHNITELHWEGDTIVGTLELNTTKGFREQGIVSSCGDEVANLIINGYKIGVSSRAVGSVEQKLGVLMVGDDLELLAWDIVCDPSTPNAYVSTTYDGLETYIESDLSKKNKPILSEKLKKLEKILL